MMGLLRSWIFHERPYSKSTRRSYGERNKSGGGSIGEDSLMMMMWKRENTKWKGEGSR